MDVVTFTIVYDNNAYNPLLRTDWGFACLVETPGTTVLFDTGADGRTLLGNMAALGLDLEAIDAIVLSHIHGDHTGGLTGLLDTGIRPTVYVPATFPVSFKDGVRARTSLVEVQGPMEIYPGIHTTGGLSNISFGLPYRGVLNRVFITLLVRAGLDAAIIDPTERDMMATVLAAEAMCGKDEFCMNYIMAERSGVLRPKDEK